MVKKRIAIYHYHLKKGGVTSVIREQVEALKADHEILVIAGEAPEVFVHDNVAVLPELGYDRTADRPLRVEQAADRLLEAIGKYFGSRCDVLHFHNPILAKNRGILGTIKLLAGRGVNIFLQIHDFAEDGRLGFYATEEYPADVHYGVINSRDYRYLLESGLDEAGLHLIPNCVRELPDGGGDLRDRRLILYPVRAIRRKNIGEVLLLSLFLKGDDHIGLTLPALGSHDLKSYEDWKLLAREQGLPVAFDLGTRFGFEELVRRAKSFVTTSVAEGFGFAYLEPWACGLPLWGRKIRGLSEDFAARGIDLDGLYEEFLVPRDLVDAKRFQRELTDALRRAEKYHEGSLDAASLTAEMGALLERAHVDFGLLAERNQADIVLAARRDKRLRERLLAANPLLAGFVENRFDAAALEKNRRAVGRNFSRAAYARALNDMYEKVTAVRVRQSIDKKKLIASFLQANHLSLLKWGAYDR